MSVDSPADSGCRVWMSWICVSPRVTMSSGFTLALCTRWSPRIVPLAELRSRISIPDPTVMRACFLDTRGSARVIAQEGERPITVPPKAKGTRMPLSGPARIRSSPATPPVGTEPSVEAMSMRDPEWRTVSVTNAVEGNTETTRPPMGSRILRVTDSGSIAGAAPSGPAAARTAATSPTVAVASVVTSRSISSRVRPRSVSLIFIAGPFR